MSKTGKRKSSFAHEPAQFVENAVYTTEQVGRIIGRNVVTVRHLCRSGAIRARCDRAGFMITGWAIRAYLECRCDLYTDSGNVK